jgi:hypothetical protein
MTTGPFGVEVVSKSLMGFKKAGQVKNQMKLVSETGNKVLQKTPNFNPSGVMHGSPRLGGPKKAGDSVKTVKLNMAGTQARKKFGNG